MGIGDSPEETLRVDASAASHRVRGLGIADRGQGNEGREGRTRKNYLTSLLPAPCSLLPAPRSPISNLKREYTSKGSLPNSTVRTVVIGVCY
ncbi:hypothetical protein BLD44_025875 [Mastigocladus laminosus UU774]|nr:hypothetical protein BLD44_025875 [Mastigocladus laminosus UU774]